MPGNIASVFDLYNAGLSIRV